MRLAAECEGGQWTDSVAAIASRQHDAPAPSCFQVRERIIKRIMRRKSERGDKDGARNTVSSDSSDFQWSDSGRSSYQHHIATVYATAVVAGLRIGHTTDRVLNKVR